jgi:voltage-gated potassium channel
MNVQSVMARKWYGGMLLLVTFTAVVFVMLVLTNIIDLMKQPFRAINDTMIGIFTFDYLWRFFHTKTKWRFLKENIFDLLAIIPFFTILSFLQLNHFINIGKVARFALLGRLVGVSGKLNHSTNRFLNTNGFYHLIYVGFILIIFGSFVYSGTEKVSFGEALWWAITTTTTVGYGDVSPHTAIGKLAATVLMFLGIGIIGLLTSTITSYFTDEKDEEMEKEEQLNNAKICELEQKIDLLLEKIEDLEKSRDK